MAFLSRSTISVRDRLRTSAIDRAIVGQLRESIRTKGLLHPPVIASEADGTCVLVAGLHRLTAIDELHRDEVDFFYDGILVPRGSVPVTNLFELSAADLLEAELEENTIRSEMNWQDRTRAISAIHSRRKADNPLHTFKDTADELMTKAGRGGAAASGTFRIGVRNATILAENLHLPSIAKARNATEALGILLKEEGAKLEAELIERRRSGATSTPQLIQVRHGDLKLLMPQMPEGEVDLILADLPYGIDVDKGGFRSRTVEHHNYEDSKEIATDLLKAVISEGFRVCKPRANLLLFGDIDLFPLFKSACGVMGWKPFRTPIIWRKSESEGLAPWGREGFRRTYEMIFFATKGQRGLLQSPVDVLDESRVPRHLRRFGPEKPIGLIAQLIECSTMPGELILDPCCGSGATLIAARHSRRRAIGIELSEANYNLSLVAADRDPDGLEPKAESVEALA